MSKLITIENLRRDALHTRSELQQLINDVESWNENRGDEGCFDCGAEKVALKYVNDHLAELDRAEAEGGPINESAINRVVEVLAASVEADS